MRKTVIVFFALSITFGLISYSKAESMSFDWDGMGCSENVIFDFEVRHLPNQDSYTLDGKAVSRFNGFTYPARGGAVFNPVTNNFQVTIFYTSATGETFTFGASLDTATLSGSGNVQRIAHGDTNDDCEGRLSVLDR